MGTRGEERRPVRIARKCKGRVLYSTMIALRCSILPHSALLHLLSPASPVLRAVYYLTDTLSFTLLELGSPRASLPLSIMLLLVCLIPPAPLFLVIAPSAPASSIHRTRSIVPHSHRRANAIRSLSRRSQGRNHTRCMSRKMSVGASRWRVGRKTRGTPKC